MPEQAIPLTKTAKNAAAFCPHLGLYDDPATRYGFSSTGNYCHKRGEPLAVDLAMQTRLCLGKSYPECKVYQEANPPARRRVAIQAGWMQWLVVVVGLAVIGAAGFFLFMTINHNPRAAAFLSVPAATPTEQSAAMTAAATEALHTPTFAPTATLTAAPTTTSTPNPVTPTPTRLAPTEGPLPGTPFGPNFSFIFYRVNAADSMTRIAQDFNTSVEVILAANVFKAGRAMWPGDILVLLPGIIDPAGVQHFQVIELTEAASVEVIASEYQINIEDVRYFNNLGDETQIPAGRLLIIPVP